MHTEADWDRAICENPLDTQIRLIFCDWLEENGQGERATLIRLHEQLDNTEECEHTRWGYFKGCSKCDLICKLQPHLTNHFDYKYETNPLKLRYINTQTEILLTNYELFFTTHPIIGVKLSDKRPCVATSVECLSYQWCWSPDQVNFRHNYFMLPVQIFSLLKQGKLFTDSLNNYIVRSYPNIHVAEDDLSAACVLWGRLSVNLPPLYSN